jgi:hypothetical protein
MKRETNMAEKLAEDIRSVMRPLVGRPSTKKSRDIARRACECILRKYRENGFPIDDVIVLRSVPSNEIYVRVVRREGPVADDGTYPVFELPCPVYDLARYRAIKRPCNTCHSSGEVASGRVDEDGDELPPVICERCSGSGVEPRGPGITKA